MWHRAESRRGVQVFRASRESGRVGVSLATAKQRILSASQSASSFDVGVLPEVGAYQASLSLQFDDAMRFSEEASAQRQAFQAMLQWGPTVMHEALATPPQQTDEHLAAFRKSLLRHVIGKTELIFSLETEEAAPRRRHTRVSFGPSRHARQY